MHDAGTSGAAVEDRIDSLRRQLSSAQVSQVHYLRMHRNALQFRQARPPDDPERWEAECRRACARLRDDGSLGLSDGPGGTSRLTILGCGLAAYVVLQNERLVEAVATGALFYLRHKMFFGK